MAHGVLDSAPMSRAALAAVALVAASSSSALAGPGFLGVGIGTAPAFSSDATGKEGPDGRSGRVFGGYRWRLPTGSLAAEATVGRFDLVHRNVPFSSTTLGVGAKYNFPLGNQFEVFGRTGVQRTWLTTDRAAAAVESNVNGFYLGAGFDYVFRVLNTDASVFVDYQWAPTSVTNGDMSKYDTSARMWTMGVTVSL